MPMQILSHTPTWVFVLFALLLWAGTTQLVTRRVRLGRVAGIAIGMGLFGAYGVVSAFPASLLALPLALLAGAATATVVARRPVPQGTRYDADHRRFVLPGSAVPLALMMGLFAVKYTVGVTLALQPSAAAQAAFVIGVSVLYGAFGGTFAGRALRLVALARGAEVGALRGA